MGDRRENAISSKDSKRDFSNVLRAHLDIALEKVIPVENGKAGSRSKSWGFCHRAFASAKKDGTVNSAFLSLNLAFYLASWGMYRGSSFLLDRDYTAHFKTVQACLESDESLWELKPWEKTDVDVNGLLFGRGGLVETIRKSYEESSVSADRIQMAYDPERTDKPSEKIDDDLKKPTDTLISKILLGTLSCVPALDLYFKAGCKELDLFKSKSIELDKETFEGICGFASNHKAVLEEYSKKLHWPAMKCLDFALWSVGFCGENIKKIQANPTEKAAKYWNALEKYGYFSGEHDTKAIEAIEKKYLKGEEQRSTR